MLSKVTARYAMTVSDTRAGLSAEELALDGIQSYDPEEERAWRESQEVFAGRVMDEDVPG